MPYHDRLTFILHIQISMKSILTPKKLSRKTIELKERTVALLQIAEDLIRDIGFESFKLDDLTEPSGFSRGTIYIIFKTKDILIAMLAIKAFGQWNEMSDKANHFKGSTRERLLAFHIAHILFMHTNPSGYEAIYISDLYTNRSKMPEQLLLEFDRNINRIVNGLCSLIEEAVRNKEVVFPDYFTPTEFALNMWSGQYGMMVMALNHKDNIQFYTNQFKKFMRLVADNLPWHPTSFEKNYELVTQKIIAEVFLAEYTAVKKENPTFI